MVDSSSRRSCARSGQTFRSARCANKPEHEQLLESMVDVLDLREWPEPKTISERLRAMWQMLRMAFHITEGRDPPDWRSV